MFHQVKLKPYDADAVRFLWKEDPSSTYPPDHYQMFVHIFDATDSPCFAAYALRKAAMDQREEFTDEMIDAVLRSFYVEDLLRSLLDEIKAINLTASLDKLPASRGFNLTKFNSQTLLQAIPPEKRTTISSIEFENSITRVLGVK